MRKRADKLRKRFKLKKAFSIILISYILMLFIPIILSGYLIFMVNDLTAARYRENIAANLEQSSLMLEKRIEVMQKNAQVLTNNFQLMQTVRLQKLQPGDTGVLQIIDFQKYLKTLFPDDLSQYAVILKNGYAFTPLGVSNGREFFYRYSRNYENMEYEEWLERSFFSAERNLFPFQAINLGTNTKNAMTFSLPVGSYYMPEEADGCVQFLIEEEYLREIFLPILRLDGGHVMIYADNGDGWEPVLRLSQDTEAYSLIDAKVPDFRHQQGYIKLEEDQSEDMQEVVYTTSQTGRFIAAAYMPKGLILNETKQIRTVLFWLVGISFLIEIGLGIYFSGRYSTPIRNLIRNIYHILQPEDKDGPVEEKQSGEYDRLESGVNMIIRKNAELQSEISERDSRETRDFYRRLCMGLFANETEAESRRDELQISMSARGYAVAVFRMNEKADAVREYLRSLGARQIHWVQSMEDGLTAVFLETGEDMEEAAETITEDLRNSIMHSFGVKVPAGLGRSYQRLTDITFSYDQAVYCTRISDNTQECSIAYDAAAQNLNILFYPAELEEKLVNSTRHGDMEGIEDIFGQISRENAVKRHLSGAMERLLSANIMATLLKVYSDVIPEEKIESILGKKNEVADIEEMLLTHKQMFLDICSELSRSRSGRQEDFRKQLEIYMEENYQDTQMSVKSAAENFDFSESYFSIMFKETTGEAFSTYLERIRLLRAKQLLEEGCGVETAAERVGYNNSGTFRRAFKRATGISPTAWKENQS